MSFKSPGIKEVYLAPGSAAFPSDGAGAIGLGYKDTSTFKTGPFGEIKSKSGRVYSSRTNFRAEVKTEQMGYDLLKFIIGACKASDVSAKIITSGVAKVTDFTATGGIFTFENTKSLGIDFDLTLSPKERILTIGLENSYKASDATTLITASKTNTLKGTLKIPALDAENIVKGYISPVFGNITIADDRLSDWKMNLKSRQTKNAINKAIVSKIDVDFMAVMDGIDPDELNDFLLNEFCPDLTMVIGVETPYDIILKEGGLTQMGEAEIDDEKRTGTVHFTGSYDIDFVDTSTGNNITLEAQL
jgi:hypothetical protein